MNAANSHLKDDFSCSSSPSRTSSIEASTFSSFLRTHVSIEVASMILEKKINEILHLDSNTPEKVFETLTDRKPKLSFDLTSKPVTFEPDHFYCLEEPSCVECMKVSLCFDLSEELPMSSFESKHFFESEQDDCEFFDS